MVQIGVKRTEGLGGRYREVSLGKWEGEGYREGQGGKRKIKRMRVDLSDG